MSIPLDLPRFEARGLCADADDKDLWHPPSGGVGAKQAEAAKRVCNGANGKPPCAARDECLAYAIGDPKTHGVWGGRSEKERQEIRKTLPPRPPALPERCQNDHRYGTDNVQLTARGRRCRTCHNRATQDSRRAAG